MIIQDFFSIYLGAYTFVLREEDCEEGLWCDGEGMEGNEGKGFTDEYVERFCLVWTILRF